MGKKPTKMDEVHFEYFQGIRGLELIKEGGEEGTSAGTETLRACSPT